jgi:hypothetical protein
LLTLGGIQDFSHFGVGQIRLPCDRSEYSYPEPILEGLQFLHEWTFASVLVYSPVQLIGEHGKDNGQPNSRNCHRGGLSGLS